MIGTLALLAATLSAPHVPHRNHTPAQGPVWGSSMGAAERTYYLDLFGQTAKVCPLPNWRSFVTAVEKLYVNSLPIAHAQALYDQLALDLPVLRVEWDGSSASLVGFPPLELAAGVERSVLVEVTNLSSSVHVLRAKFAGSRESNAARSPSGITRGLVAQVLVTDLNATQVALSLKAQTLTSTVMVPISVVEPAHIVGVLFDQDLQAQTPGRVWVRGADRQLRHGKTYKNNVTLSLKPIVFTQNVRYTYRLPFFYTNGQFQIDVPPGESIDVTFERGYEHPLVTKTLTLAPGETREIVLASKRSLSMRDLGWTSGETHVHWVTNEWIENEDLDLLAMVQRAEDIQVVNNLTINSFGYVKPDQFPMGPVPGFVSSDYLIHMAEEYRNDPFYGHVNMLNIVDLVQPITTGNLLGPEAEDYPINATQIDIALSQIPPTSRPIIVAAHGLGQAIAADVVLNKIDSLDQLAPNDYYSLLDAGIRVPLTDGADHPARVVGQARCYVKTQGPMTYGAWIDGIIAGSTFSTSGPLMFLDVDGTDIGGELQVSAGATLNLHVEAHSRTPIGRLQVVSNGQMLYDQPVATNSVIVDLPVTADQSRWIVARCSDALLPDFYPSAEPNAAHTSAIYVIVNSQPIFNDNGAAESLRDQCEQAGDYVYDFGTFYAPGAQEKRFEARGHFYRGRDEYQTIINTLGNP